MWPSAHKLILYNAAVVLAALLCSTSFAQSGPANFNVSGGLFQSNGTPITSASVNFRIEIWDKGANCMLYSELHLAQDLSDSKGGFSLIIGSGSSQSNPLEGNTTFSSRIFRNTGAVPAFGGCGGGVTLAPGDERLIRVAYDIGGGYVTMTPDVPITSAPYAMVAESLQGKSTSDFILTNVNTQLSQNSMEYLFTNTNYASLKALVDGTSTQYVAATPLGDVNLNSNRLVNVADPSAPQDASTKNYADTSLGGQPLDMTGVSPGVGGGNVLKWDDIQNKWIAAPVGGVASITAGSGLLGGTIISSGTLSVDVGVTANKILQLNGSAQIPAVDGSLLTNVNAFQLRGLDISGVAPADGQVMTWNSTSAQWQAVTPSGGTITALTGDVTASGSGSVVATIANDAVTSAKINSTGIAKNLLLITDSTTGVGVGYMSCSLGQVLQWDANGWGCVDMSVALGTSGVTAGTYGSDTMVSRVTVDAQGRVTALSNVNIAFPVTSVEGRTGAVDLIASDIDGLGSAALVNVGTGSSNVPQLDAFGRMPAVDGSQLTNLTAGSVSGVATGTGLVGGTITTYGTLSVDVGTTAGKIMQLTGGAQIPAVDGNLIMNINAVKLQARDVSAAAPGGGQVLGWNAINSVWEPSSVTSGTVTQVSSGTGLLGGTISSTGTLSVDVGTTAGKIVQLDGAAQLPAVDGSQLTNLNATRIGTRTIATTAPGVGQYIGWNNTTAQWEPMATTTGTVTSVATGTGLVGGPISSTGTLSVDVGTAANQIMQLTTGAQIPAVDGNLVTNVNAVKLQARDVSAAAPGSGQVLGWNGSSGVWEPMSAAVGSVTNVATGTGLLGGSITSSGTLSVDVGTTANQIMQLTAGAQIPAVDGNLVTNVNAVKLQARDVSASAPGGGQVLGWNAATSVWEPLSVTSGTVTQISSGTGLTGGPISANGTLSVDVGTTANKIVQLDGSALLPAVDGSQLTNLNATRIGTRTIATTAPGIGEYIGWNNSTSQWEPMATTTGTVTNVATGTGLTGGPISSTGTLSVDVGTAANKIMQLTAGAQIPAVDGNLVTNVNAVKLQARDVSASAPGGGQVLGWNAATSVWEPMPVTSGTVIQIASGTGLVGGPISSVGTLSVDVGTTANKIVQLDGSALLPAVDGSQLTNLNATRIGTRTIATTAPGVGQYIGWNNSTSQWEPMATTTGTVTNVATGTGLLGGPISSNGTLSVDVGTAANQVMQLTAGAQIPAVDGNLVTNVNAVKLQARDVATTAPTSGQVLGWNGLNGTWEPMSTAVGSVTNVATGTGLLGGSITSSGTLSVDVGTTAGKIVQLDGSAQLPGVDGSQLTNLNATRIGTRTIATTAPGIGEYIGWNNSTSQWEPMATTTGTVTNVATGTGLTGGPISSTGTLSVDVGTAANKIMQLTAGAQIPAVDGNLVTNVNAVKLQARDVSASAPGGGQVLGWNASTSVWEPMPVTSGTVIQIASGTGLVGGPISSVGTLSVDVGTTANKIVQLDGSALLPAVDGSPLTNLNATRIGTRTIATSAPGVGQYLGWNNSTSQWEPMATTTGTVTNIATGLGLTGGPISSTGTLSVDVGTAANQVMQLTAGAQIPAVDGNLVTNVNAVKLQARDVATTAPTSGQVLGWNGLNGTWEPMSTAVGSVTNVATGTGLVGGSITSSGTLSVDVGTAANKIMQLTAGAQIPAVDGNLVTNVNAVKLQARDISSSAPGGGQVLGWNSGTSMWEPLSVTSGTVTQISSGTGLTGGPISGNGTLSVDVGTAANKIMQLTAGAQIPAVDGNLVTNVNAVKLQARDVSASAPGGGQVLGWNSGSSVWEPMATTTGTVTNVATGTGLVGGPISAAGTLSVDVGTAANKIMQLTAGAQIPAVDGNLVTNINAVKLQARDVSASAPGGGQVLGWNSGTSMWEPLSVTSGTVTQISSGTGLTGGPISGNGTLSVDVGTTANKIVQLDGAAQLPGVDGSQLTNLNATRIGTRTIATSAPGVGQYLGWNNSTSQWEPMATTTGTVTNVATGTGLVGGPISATGTLSVDVGTAANKIMQLTAGAQIPAVDGNLVTNINAVKLQTRDVATTAPTSGQVLGWNGSNAQWEPISTAVGSVTNIATGTGLLGGSISSSGTLSVDVGTAANKIMQLTAGAQIPAVDGNLVTNVNAVKLQARDVSASAPGGGQVLGWNATTSVWEPLSVTSGTVMQITSGTGLTGGPISSIGTLSVDVGTTANKIVQLDGAAQLPGVDGSQLTNLNATRIGTRAIATSAPGVGQYLGWNSSTSQWEPMATTTGTVTNVATGTGLVGGPISATGTLSVDVGTAANKIMQLTAGAQIPAVDGNLVTNVNAVKLQARDVSSSAPGGGQVLGWNSGTSVWEPLSVTSGTVTQISSGTGLTGGPISANGTLSVDVGTTANKIVQLDSSAQLPGVDGSQLTNLNATRIGTRTIATSAPGVGQYLGWNNSTSQWEPMAATTGTVTNVATGTGLTGGPISSTGTLSVDVGTAANKIVQLTADAQLPAVDGFLVTNVNAWRNGGNLYGANATIGTTDNFNLSLVTNNNPRVTVTAAGNVGVGTSIPQALLDLSTTTSGQSAIIVPRDTAANRPPTGVNGMIRFNNTTNKFEAYQGVWQDLISNGGSPPVGAANAIQASNGSGAFISNNNMVIDATNGRMGLGTSAPAAHMHIVSDGGATPMLLQNVGSTGIAINPYYPSVGLNQYHDGTQWRAIGAGYNGGWGIDPWSGIMTFAISSSSRSANQALGNNAADDVMQFFPTGEVAIGTHSQVYIDSIRNIGIGTIAPQALLDLTTTTSGYSAIIVPRDTAANRPPTGVNGMIRFNTTTQKIEAYQGAWQDMISSGGGGASSGNIGALQSSDGSGGFLSNNNIVIDQTNGRLGIGIATPGVPLDVNGLIRSAYGSNSSALNYGHVSGTNTTGGKLRLQRANPPAADEALGTVEYLSSNGIAYAQVSALATESHSGNKGTTLAFSTTPNGTSTPAEGMRIDHNGNVGIGTTTPGAKLSVGAHPDYTAQASDQVLITRDGGDNYLRIHSAGGYKSGIYFANIYGNQASYIQHDDTANSLTLGTNGTPRITIERWTGSVGIGTTMPQALLDLATTMSGQSAIIVPRDTTANRPPTGVNGMLRYNTNTSAFEAYANGAWSSLGGGSGSQWNNGASSSINYVAGNVGIGTGTPTSPLHVAKAGGTGVTAAFVGDGNYSSVRVGNTNRGFPGVYMEFTAGDEANTNYDGAAIRTVGFTAPLIIDSSNGVIQPHDPIIMYSGVGNSASYFPKMEIGHGATGTGTDNNYGLTVFANDVWQDLIVVDTLSASHQRPLLQIKEGGNSRLFVDKSGGNVGIGTSVPQAILDVASTTSGRSAIIVPRDTAANRPPTGVNGMIRYNTTSNKFEAYQGAWQDLISTGGASPSGVSGAIQVNNGSGAFTSNNNIVMDTTNGRVGIGTPTPGFKLDVNGTLNASSIYLNGSLVNIYNVTASTPSTGGTVQMIEQTATNAATNYRSVLQVRNDGTGGAYELNILGQNAAGVTTFAVAQDGSGYFGNRLGIGTVTPQVMLDVASVASGDSAIIIPRDTTANRPPTGVNGMIRYNTNTSKFEAFESGSWTSMISSGAVASGNTGAIQYNNGSGAFTSNNNVVIDGTNGRIGVGLTNPSYNFDANQGSLRAGGIRTYYDGGNNWIDSENSYFNIRANLGQAGGQLSLEAVEAINMKAKIVKFGGQGSSDPYVLIDRSVNASTHDGILVSAHRASGHLPKYFMIQGQDTEPSYDYGITGGDVYVAGGESSWPSGPGNVILGFSPAGTAKGKVGIGTSAPQAILDIVSTTSGQSSIIVPRSTTANRGTGVNGMIRYNTNTSRFEAFENASWVNMTSSGAGSSGNSGAIQVSNGSGGFVSNNNISINTTSGRVGIGTASASTELEVLGTTTTNGLVVGGYTAHYDSVTIVKNNADASLMIQNSSSTSGRTPGLFVVNYTGGNGGAPQSVFVNGRGNAGTPAALQASDLSGQMVFAGYGSSSVTGVTAVINSLAAANFSATSTPGDLLFSTTPSGAIAAVERMRIDAAGRIGVGTASPRALLDLTTTVSGYSAIVVPGDTAANRPPTGVNGMIRYNTNSNALEAHVNGGWDPVETNRMGPVRFTRATIAYNASDATKLAACTGQYGANYQAATLLDFTANYRGVMTYGGSSELFFNIHGVNTYSASLYNNTTDHLLYTYQSATGGTYPVACIYRFAPLRFTRTNVAYNASGATKDAQCVTDFGSNFQAATKYDVHTYHSQKTAAYDWSGQKFNIYDDATQSFASYPQDAMVMIANDTGVTGPVACVHK